MIIIIPISLLFTNPSPNNPMRMCPVLRLAVSRTANVMGRTRFLTNSITQRKGFRNAGEPIGWKWASRLPRS